MYRVRILSRLLLLPVLAVVFLGCGDESEETNSEKQVHPSEPIMVMTFNVLCSFCDVENYDPWIDRLDYFADIFARHNPDLIGLQEPFEAIDIEQILEILPGFEALYFQNDDFLKDYPDSTILYRADRFEVVENGFYWLSPSPDDPWTTGFASGGQLPRLLAWAHLREIATGVELYFASTHFDNNTPSQALSAPLVIERTAEWAGEMPVIVLGDFNSQPNDPAYLTLVDETADFAFINAFDVASNWRVDTNRDPVPEYDVEGRIDHIFVAGADWQVSEWVVDLYSYGDLDRYPSDHFAIAAELTW
jgi:endonuclease/exonuclease/phosphatase family metal-dependent hydrolase